MTIPAGNVTTDIPVNCQPGEKIIGAGFDVNGANGAGFVYSSLPLPDGTGWDVFGDNSAGMTDASGFVVAICVAP